MRPLFVGVGELEELSFSERTPEELEPHREFVAGESRRDGDGGKPDERAQIPVVTQSVGVLCLRVREGVGRNQAGLVIERRIHERIELIVRHDGQDTLPELFPG